MGLFHTTYKEDTIRAAIGIIATQEIEIQGQKILSEMHNSKVR